MKWNGTVSQYGHSHIATRFATAKATQAASRDLCRNQAVARIANRLDRRLRAELLAQAADEDVDDVRAGVEVEAPDLREEPFAADHLARVRGEMMEEAELAIRERGDVLSHPRLPPREVERERPGADDVFAAAAHVAKLNPDACEQLVEGERLAQVVARAEAEAAELGREVGAGRDDHHRQRRLLGLELAEDGEAVEPGEEQVEEDEVVAVLARPPQP